MLFGLPLWLNGSILLSGDMQAVTKLQPSITAMPAIRAAPLLSSNFFHIKCTSFTAAHKPGLASYYSFACPLLLPGPWAQV